MPPTRPRSRYNVKRQRWGTLWVIVCILAINLLRKGDYWPATAACLVFGLILWTLFCHFDETDTHKSPLITFRGVMAFAASVASAVGCVYTFLKSAYIGIELFAVVFLAVAILTPVVFAICWLLEKVFKAYSRLCERLYDWLAPALRFVYARSVKPTIDFMNAENYDQRRFERASTPQADTHA